VSFLRAIRNPDGEFVLNSLARMAGWVIESMFDDPECFVLVTLACAALCIVGLLVWGIGAAVSDIASNGFSRDGLQGLGLR